MNAYHFNNGQTLRDGQPLPALGETLVHAGPVVPCRSGLHASEHPFDALRYAPGLFLDRVTLGGEIVAHGDPIDKYAASERTRIASIDATDIVVKFAKWCAEQAARCATDAASRYAAYAASRYAAYAAYAARCATDAAYAANAARCATDAANAANAARCATDAAYAAYAASRCAAYAAYAAICATDAAYAARDAQRDYFLSLVNEAFGD